MSLAIGILERQITYMHIGERRERQLKKEGVRIKMIEGKTMQIIEELKKENYTLLEGRLLATELSCVLTEMEKHSSRIRLSEISSQILH